MGRMRGPELPARPPQFRQCGSGGPCSGARRRVRRLARPPRRSRRPPSARPSSASAAAWTSREAAAPQHPRAPRRSPSRLARVRVRRGAAAMAGETAALQERLSGHTVTAAANFRRRPGAGTGLRRRRLRPRARRPPRPAPARRRRPAARRDRRRHRTSVVVTALPPEVRDRIAAVLAPLVGAHGLTLKSARTGGAARRRHAGHRPGAPPSPPAGTRCQHPHRRGPLQSRHRLHRRRQHALDRAGRRQRLPRPRPQLPTGHGETLYFRSFGLPLTGGSGAYLGPEPRNRALAVGLILPLGSDGLTLTLETTDSRATPSRCRFGRLRLGLQPALGPPALSPDPRARIDSERRGRLRRTGGTGRHPRAAGRALQPRPAAHCPGRNRLPVVPADRGNPERAPRRRFRDRRARRPERTACRLGPAGPVAARGHGRSSRRSKRPSPSTSPWPST